MALAYEFGRLVQELAKKEGNEKIDFDILRELQEVKFRKGSATGDYKLKQSESYGTYFQFPVVVKKIKGEEFEEVWP
jgi:hypothetical protein